MLTYIQIFLQPVDDVHVKRFILEELDLQLHITSGCTWLTKLSIKVWSMCLTSQENVNLHQDQNMSLKGQAA